MTTRPDDWNNRVDGIDGDDCDYARPPSFVSTADPKRLEAIFEKARQDAENYRFNHRNPWKLTRGEFVDMENAIRDAKAESRVLTTGQWLDKTCKQIGAE